MKKSTKISLISIVLVLVGLFAWAGLTKAGYIKNYLNIDILCSEQDVLINERKYPSMEEQRELMESGEFWKPVIYLYPEEPMEVNVKLEYSGELIADYPDYDDSLRGWKVFAYPNGKIINNADNKEYSYLFWEGRPTEQAQYNLSSGFVVKGSETKKFLQSKLEEIGLTSREYNEFIVFWYPKMKDNAYNLIHFAGEEYTDTAPLTINPEPDSTLRVFMAYKPLQEYINIETQTIKPFARKGFAVVEWGGTEIK